MGPLALWLLLPAVSVLASQTSSSAVWATPHEQFSSSVGVLGCKIDTNRVAYWPGSVDCDNICLSLTYEGRSAKLLRIDSSEGAYDISYDAWNYLYTGYSARDQPATGGPIPMDFKYLHPSECAELIYTEGNKLPFSAPTGTNLLVSCLTQPDSWIAQNYVLYNIIDSVCSWGYDEECTLDWPSANQASCPHILGLMESLTSTPVYNIQYGTGKVLLASTGQVIEDGDISFASREATTSTNQLWSLLAFLLSLQYALFCAP
ncbi:hypothetical protein DL766_005087 [Monosporascus sp. MC13-8B]|nr:hypothetical protein DL766_005087 [Monosporascus sp. MC13-8B]